jgi:hypothetical protein
MVAQTVHAQKLINLPQCVTIASQAPYLKILLAKIDANPLTVLTDDETKSLVLKLVSQVIE